MPDWLPAGSAAESHYEPKADAYQFINSLFVLIFIPLFNVFFRSVDPQMKTFTAVRRSADRAFRDRRWHRAG